MPFNPVNKLFNPGIILTNLSKLTITAATAAASKNIGFASNAFPSDSSDLPNVPISVPSVLKSTPLTFAASALTLSAAPPKSREPSLDVSNDALFPRRSNAGPAFALTASEVSLILSRSSPACCDNSINLSLDGSSV